MRLDDVLEEQAGVVRRAQLLRCDLGPHDIRRMTRRRDLVVVHAGVYVDHTGALTWLQRAWAGVLACWPAALSHRSALRAAQGAGRRDQDESVIHVAVAQHRHFAAPEGVRVHRMVHYADRVHPSLVPPRIRYDDALLDVALAEPVRMSALGLLADACGSRRTTARRLLDRVAARGRVPERAWVTGVLTDVAEGTCSVLEREYATAVERAHGLPRAVRQERSVLSTGVVYRDASYGELVVELDGRLCHDTAGARDRDLERDLDTAVGGAATIRLGWGQVHARPCTTARKLAQVMLQHGLEVTPRPCGPDCCLGRDRGVAA